MSEFECIVTKVAQVEQHPNADRLEILRLEGMDYNLISGTGNYKVGDKVAYLPENSILPDNILEELGMTGNSSLKKLDGKRCIIKCIRLRGVFSEGMVYRVSDDIEIGTNVAELLGIRKYVPRQPEHFAGRIRPRGPWYNKMPLWDLEPLQKSVGVFKDGEPVFVTEKLHGTQINCGALLDDNGVVQYYVTSKGLAKRGDVLDHENNPDNLYCRIFNSQLKPALEALMNKGQYAGVSVCGEIVGPGVQDLTYGLSEPTLFVFAVRVKSLDDDKYTLPEFNNTLWFCGKFNIRSVPWHTDLFDYEQIKQLAEGKEQVSYKSLHITEGVVVSRPDGSLYKKYVGENYKTRGNNATEYE